MATPINIIFTVGTLEPGEQYTPQQLLEAFAERLLGEVQQDTLAPGVSGPVAPTQDKGVWINTSTDPHSPWFWSPVAGAYVQDSSQTPVGGMLFWPGVGAIPSNFRNCDGAALSKINFPMCYQALGGTETPYGQTGTTFNLPDASGRTMFGIKTGWEIGDKKGEETVRLGVNNIPAHTHDLVGRQETTDHVNRSPIYAIIDDDWKGEEVHDPQAVRGGGNGEEFGDEFSILSPGLVGRWIIRVS